MLGADRERFAIACRDWSRASKPSCKPALRPCMRGDGLRLAASIPAPPSGVGAALSNSLPIEPRWLSIHRFKFAV